MAEFGVRWHEWGDVWVAVVRGDIDVGAAAELSRKLARLQRRSTVFVDLWDVTFIDPVVGLGVLATAKLRAEKTRWRFALIAPQGGVAAHEIEAAGLDDALPTFATKHEARAALLRS